MIFLLQQALALAILFLAAVGAGARLARALGCGGTLERLAWSVTLGLILLADGCFLAGLAGILRLWFVVALAVLSLAGGGREILELARAARLGWQRQPPAFRRLAGIGAVLFLVPFALFALYPPVEWDETIYHLPFARAFAAAGSLPVLVNLRMPIFPVLQETLSAGVLLVAGPVAPHWISWLAALATAGLLATWSPAVRGSGSRWAACMYLGSPIVVFLAGLSYVDSFLTLAVTAALSAQARAREAPAGKAWLAVAGGCAGAAAGIKYLGLFSVAWLVVESFARGGGAWRRRFSDAAIVLGAALAVAGPIYARIVAATGNPIFPFFPRIFGSSPWTYDPAALAPSALWHLSDILALLWQAALEPAAVGWSPSFGPFWLPALALAVFGAVRLRAWRWSLAMIAAYLWAMPLNARYLLPMLPLVCLIAGVTVFHLWPRGGASRRALAVGAFVLALPGWLYVLLLCARRGPVPLDGAARETFLAGRLECYSSVRYLDRSFGKGYTAYGLYLERLFGVAEGEWFGDVNGPWAFPRAVEQISRDGRGAALLRTAGVTMVVLPQRAPVSVVDALRRTGAPEVFAADGCTVFDVRQGASERHGS